MLSAISLFLSVAACTLFLALFKKRRDQHLLFARMGVPGPQPAWLSGSIKQTKHARLLHELLQEWRKTFGKTFGYYEGPIPVLVTSDLDIIREVFIKQFHNFHGRKLFPLQPDPEDPKTNHMFTARGSKWRRLRGIISPTFSSVKLRQTMPIINKKVDVLLHQMAIQAVREQSMDMLGTFQALTMEIIGSAAFGMDLNSQTDPNEPFLTKAKDMLELFERGSIIRSMAEYLPELRPCIVRFLSAVITITKATPAPVWFLKNLADVITMRREESEKWRSGRPKRVDMMQLMLEAEVEDTNLDDNDNSLHSNIWESSMKRSATSPNIATIENGKTSPTHAVKEDVMIPLNTESDISSECANDNNNAETQTNNNLSCVPSVSSEVDKPPAPKIYSNGLLKKTSKKLTTDEIKGQSFLFLVAGYETTAHTLSFVCYLLAVHQDVQDKLRAEVDAYFEEEKEIQYDTLGKMEYLDMVVSETLRIYPIANIVVNRLCMHDTVVGDLPIMEGTVIQANVMDIHMDEEIWGPQDPQEFHPERFHPDVHSKRDPLAYMPFGVGPRNCIGMRFALMEVKLALARLVRHFCFLTCPETQIPLKVKEVPALTPVEGIHLRVVSRGQSQYDLIR